MSDTATKRPKWIRATCNRCAGETKHDVVAHYGEIRCSPDALDGVPDGHRYCVARCRGCDEIHFVYQIASEDTWPEQEEEDFFDSLVDTFEYPPRLARRIPPWFGQMDETLREILEESYTALHSNSRALATMGARAALERLMLLKIPDHGRFESNVDEFIRQGFLQHRLKESLMEALEVGHAAIHRGYVPTYEVLSDLFDVLEGIINSALVLPEKAGNVQKITPIRPPRLKVEKSGN